MKTFIYKIRNNYILGGKQVELTNNEIGRTLDKKGLKGFI